ncbi:uncharacterized protein JCM15063_005194 [Sporobolomyces koalae]|uniref:uncharacterized protein n=1 Tax=Sporobolomyces koalae TaxID=500713 RepID=UPI00317A3B66
MLSPGSAARSDGSVPRLHPSDSGTASSSAAHTHKRLSRISPSEFDNLLSSSQTKHTTLLDEDTLGRDSTHSPSPSPSSSPPLARSHLDSPTSPVTPDKLSDRDRDRDPFKRRSIYRTVGNASSPDLASLVRKAKEQRALEGHDERLDQSPARPSAYELGSPTRAPHHARSRSPSPPRTVGPGSTRSRSTTSPEISLHEFAQQSAPVGTPPSAAPARIFNSPGAPPSQPSFPSPRMRTRTRESTALSYDSNLTTTSSSNASSGFVLVPPPPAPLSPPRTLTSTVQALKSQRQQQLQSGAVPDAGHLTSLMQRPNPSTSSLISSFGLDFATAGPSSPRRKRGTTSDSNMVDDASGKLSLGNTMRKTSRFFRKFGQASSSTTESSQPKVVPLSSGTVVDPPPTVPVLPPVPPIPSTYTTPERPVASASTSTLPMTRDRSNQSIESSTSFDSTASSARIRRKRSSSVPQSRHSNSSAGAGPSSPSPAKSTRVSGEGDRLRNELRQWRLGVDGVLGGFDQTHTATARSEERPSATSSRRPSLPEGKVTGAHLDGPASLKLGRNASLPLTFETTDTPSIRLSSPNRTNPQVAPVSSRQTLSPPSTQIDLSSIPESSHSRENSNATLPAVSSESARSFNLPPPVPTLPMSPPMVPTPSSSSMTTGRKNAASRVSIVGYPSTYTTLSSTGSGSGSPRYLISPSPPTTSRPTSATGSNSSLPLAHPSVSPQPSQHSNSTLRHAPDLQASSAVEAETALSEKAKELAQRCWDEDEGFLERRKIAEWLGSSHDLNKKSLKHYMDKFDFGGLRLDLAFRRLCGKLYLKAETQQVDRILEQFSRRYYLDNPRSPYSSADVVHAVSYSLLLLNTDLHVVDTTTRMTRQQFIRNTLSAIQAQTGIEPEDETPFSPTLSEIEAGTEGMLGMISEAPNESRNSPERPRTAGGGGGSSSTIGGKRPSTAGAGTDSPASSLRNYPGGSPNQSRVTLVNHGASTDSPSRSATMTGLGLSQRSESVVTVGSMGSNKSIEANLQVVLKDMYNAIRSQPIYQSASSSTLNLPTPDGSTSRPSLSLTPGNSPYSTWSGGVNRSASRRSGTSTAASSQVYGTSTTSSKRSSVRGFGSLLGSSGAGNSSLDLMRSTSPTPSTSTSLSDEQWSTAFGAATQHHMVPTIGFANSLSHTIIREQQEDDAQSIASSSISVTDEELALLGAPWAKEGILQRKHYWESHGKRSKEKHWLNAFVVVSQGELRMFRFDGNGGSGGRKRAGIGGGDWTSNASNVGSISLIHALCSAMPPPGYSRDRPHCFVLTLPSGGSYFFQAGTPDLVAEWVSTCNYWSARLSREPLSGGVSNIEYGWNKVENKFDSQSPRNVIDERDDRASIRSGKSGHSKRSYAGSTFNDRYGSTGSSAGGLATGGNDRMRIEDWKPPNVPLTPSQLGEEAQLEHLKRHVNIVQAELAHHNELRAPMTKLYSSRSSNYAKAIANWERKSQHLLSEIVKWSTYIEALVAAVRLRSIQRGKKEVEAMLKSADLDDEEDDDDDELAARLSPFEEPPPSRQDMPTSILPPTDGIKRLQIDSTPIGSEQGDRRFNQPLASRTSFATTSMRGDEFFDS